ncbi:LacI family DNA-binding transcriptional regulator [Nocardioides panacihumi]|uniref:LacI family DNA-binding transcriptional regulator n=1 Tax=Nocardioides panacihumi TaxID=400774 RepID=A0ABN2QNQ0_9ACTN
MAGERDVQRRVGIRDVAAAAGVSPATVSQAFNGSRPVHEETRSRIVAAATALGYVPDPSARGLRLRRTGLIGLLGDHVVTTPYAGRLVLGAADALEEQGLALVAVDSLGDPDRELRLLAMLRQRNVEGVLYARMWHQFVTPPMLPGIPLAVVNAATESSDVPVVAPDEEAVGTVAAEYLLARGHRRIAFAQTVDGVPASTGREHGFRRALEAAGIAGEPLLARSASTAAGGRASGAVLLDRADRPTAVFCFNDQIAMGVYQAAAGLGLSVPEDVSVIGVDDLPLVADALLPGLTTIALPHEQMGRWAAGQLLAQISDPDHPVERALVECRLVERDSVTPPAR